ncbi:photosynthetic complex assembly protein PuhC [Lentisalinibacter orientalis]|uniref:photosynthetic complex assembly protein PuhC n=1 Tax=Lentisalinibacter orientalis TaxID=2992241 RepID=UPI00386E0CA8
MSDAHGDRIPRPAIFGALALVVLTILAAAGARLTGVGTVEVPPSAAVESRELAFEDAADGSVVVRDPAAGDVLYVVEPGTNGFLRGVLRGLARDRKLRGIGPEPAFVLTRWADGRLTLEDPETERRLYLGPFGSDNVKIFVTLLQAGAGETAQTAANGAATQR